MVNLEQYIRQAAAARGIDPDIAIRVAKSEGGLKDPTRQSLVTKNGHREPSYGPFQLLIGGSNGFPTGMGNQALAAGIDPRTQPLRGIDFALDQAKQNGWGAWYGAKGQGITGMMGIGDTPANLSPQAQQFVNSNPQPGGYGPGIADPNAPKPMMGSLAPSAYGGASSWFNGTPQQADAVNGSLSGDKKKSLSDRLTAAANYLQEHTPSAPRISGRMGDARETGNSLLKVMNEPTIASMLLRKRL